VLQFLVAVSLIPLFISPLVHLQWKDRDAPPRHRP
jgi:hypothetical protein